LDCVDGEERAELKFEKEITALLVIDPYNDFISEGGKFWDRLKTVVERNSCVPNTLRVVTAARKATLRVSIRYIVATVQGSTRPGNTSRPSRRDLGIEFCKWGGEIRREFEPQPGVLATKYTNAAPGTDPNAAGNRRKNMVQAVEASLKRLQTDYIDLYWVHIWDQLTPVEEVMAGLDDLVRTGKVLYVGISDAPAWWIAQANTLASLRGWSAFIGLQIEYSLIERTVERELIPMAKALNIGVTAWSPLAGGVLTGKYLGQASSDQKGEQARLSSEMMKDFLPEAIAS
jgi:hypothetical protein